MSGVSAKLPFIPFKCVTFGSAVWPAESLEMSNSVKSVFHTGGSPSALSTRQLDGESLAQVTEGKMASHCTGFMLQPGSSRR